jgi:hypothetical protein
LELLDELLEELELLEDEDELDEELELLEDEDPSKSFSYKVISPSVITPYPALTIP